MGFPGGSVVGNVLSMREMWVQFLCQEDPLEKEMTIHSRILVGKFQGQRSLVDYSPWG